jgi:hypothetical protein
MEPQLFAIKYVARQANSIHTYKDLKLRLTYCNANIFFNRECLNRSPTPGYASQIRIPRTSPAAATTLKKAQIQRIKDELKFLHKIYNNT